MIKNIMTDQIYSRIQVCFVLEDKQFNSLIINLKKKMIHFYKTTKINIQIMFLNKGLDGIIVS